MRETEMVRKTDKERDRQRWKEREIDRIWEWGG